MARDVADMIFLPEFGAVRRLRYFENVDPGTNETTFVGNAPRDQSLGEYESFDQELPAPVASSAGAGCSTDAVDLDDKDGVPANFHGTTYGNIMATIHRGKRARSSAFISDMAAADHADEAEGEEQRRASDDEFIDDADVAA